MISAEGKILKRELRERLSDKRWLELYALHKQATQGDVIGEGAHGLDSRSAEHIMRAKLKGMSKEKAMEDYVALVEKLKAQPLGSPRGNQSHS
jgi:carboxylesterase